MLRSILCDYSDVYILVKGTVTAEITGISAALNNRNLFSFHWLYKWNKH